MYIFAIDGLCPLGQMLMIGQRNYLEILKLFFISLILLGIGSYIGIQFIPPTLRYYMNIVFFILVLISAFSRRGGFVRNKVSMYIYSFVLGQEICI